MRVPSAATAMNIGQLGALLPVDGADDAEKHEQVCTPRHQPRDSGRKYGARAYRATVSPLALLLCFAR